MPLYAPHAVSVAVVSLYYPEPNVLPARGFGYLIPRSVPFALNSERALGVVFDSDAVPGLESSPATPLSSPSSSSSPSSPPTPQPPRQSGTMVTVMLGGHWWDGWTAFPDEREAALDACAVLQRQLRVTAVPTMVSVSLQRDCIPQYTVGHAKRLSWLHSTVRGSFRGRLRLAGSAYGGVSVNQCVKAGITAAAQLASQPDESLTGLETLVDPQYRTINREWLKQL
jgi:oxygen-dependent protoporphyrinogen oxidase